jgi:hypothetical protein
MSRPAVFGVFESGYVSGAVTRILFLEGDSSRLASRSSWWRLLEGGKGGTDLQKRLAAGIAANKFPPH